MSWEQIQGLDLAKRVLQAHMRAERVAQAYLLAGPEGIGKRRLAHEMAKALQCAAGADLRACDRCTSCAQIDKRLHPDVHWLNPSGASERIKIEDVRQVRGRIALRPFHARWHVVIIDGADRLTDAAANTLLKSLEEPPGQTCFLLIAAQLSRCLPTIVSRCQVIRCQRLAPQIIEAVLATLEACPREAAGTIARLAEGSAGRAVELASQWSAHQTLMNQLASDDPVSWLASPLPETREHVRQWLDQLMAWLRDLAAYRTMADPSGMTHPDAAAAIQRQAARIHPDQCVEAMMTLHELRDSLEQFANPRLVASMARETWLEVISAGRMMHASG